MPKKNSMTVQTIKPDGAPGEMTIFLADDSKEVRGFGQPIPADTAKKMTDRFYNDCKKAYEIVEILEKTGSYQSSGPGDKIVQALKNLLDPEKQVVSGVFGKEILLHLLTQRNAEGIRYALGTDFDGAQTIVLFAVRQAVLPDGKNLLKRRKLRNGKTEDVAVSVPLPVRNSATSKSTAESEEGILVEVHKNSITRAEAEVLTADTDATQPSKAKGKSTGTKTGAAKVAAKKATTNRPSSPRSINNALFGAY